jgi:hypothetical protein
VTCWLFFVIESLVEAATRSREHVRKKEIEYTIYMETRRCRSDY